MGRRAAWNLRAGGVVLGKEMQAHASDSGAPFGLPLFRTALRGPVKGVERIKGGAILDAGIVGLRRLPGNLAGDANVFRHKDSCADVAEDASERGSLIEVAVGERLDLAAVGAVVRAAESQVGAYFLSAQQSRGR